MKRKIFVLLCSVLLLTAALFALTACGCDHRDADDDGKCDYCGDKYRDGKDNKGSDCEHRDANDDARCDKCGESFSDGEDVLKTYKRCDADGTLNENGDYLLFGEYPQSLKASDVTVTSETDSRGYYLGSDGFYYAQVTAAPYGSHGYIFSNGESITKDTVYYFKVEPIRWRILTKSGNEAIILCDSIIANMPYDAGADNNYKKSDIRAFLNASFYETAFNTFQKQLILETTVDNSVASTGSASNAYACENTVDKVFLLSFSEVINNESHGFASDSTVLDPLRAMITSDYARATGALTNFSGNFGRGHWWVRSPYNYYSIVRCVEDTGRAGHNYDVGNAGVGVVPALWIRL